MQGIITKIIENKGFFFIDNDYKCFFDKVSFSPQVLARVEYERDKDKNGKSLARNVRIISSATTNSNASGPEFFHLYLEDLAKGYFEKENYIREEFIAGHAKKLAGFFESNPSVNKTTQIRKYFGFCRKIEGIYKVKRDFNYVKSELPKLNYITNYALNKKPPVVSKEFRDFIEKNLELALINENNFLKGFLYHFEAVIGYSKNN